MDRLAARIFVGLCVVAIGTCGVSLWPMFRGARTSAGDVHVADPASALRDARALIASREKSPQELTAPASLPPSLRIDGLRYATVHEDHVDLVIARNPDISMGARIWSARHRPHRDRPTSYREIYFFRHDNDVAESPDNLR